MKKNIVINILLFFLIVITVTVFVLQLQFYNIFEHNYNFTKILTDDMMGAIEQKAEALKYYTLVIISVILCGISILIEITALLFINKNIFKKFKKDE